jgi:hypothetical protein
MASWKKVIVSGSAAELASLTLDTVLAASQGGTGISNFADSTHKNSNTTKGDVGLGNVENTALSTYTGNGGALDNQYITNGAGYITSFTNTVDMGDGFNIGVDTNTNSTTIIEGETLTFTGGTGISTETTANGTITFTNSAPFSGDVFDNDGTFASLRAQGTTKGDVGLGNVENTALSTYTGNGGALDNQYITNGAGYITSFTNTVDMGDGFTVAATTTGTGTTITEGDSLTIAAGTGISTTGTSDGVVTIANTAPFSGDVFDNDGTFASLRAQGTTKGDVGLGNVENTALSTYTGNGGALDNQYITNGAGYITSAGTVDDVSIPNLKTALAGGFGSNAVQIGDSNDVVTIGNTLKVTGDLIVNGDTTTLSTTNLSIEDQFITIASGSTSPTDGGLVVSKQSDGAGYGFGYDTATTRWGFQDGLAINATGIVPDAFVGAIEVHATAAPSSAPVYGGELNGFGTIHVKKNTGDIYIYA